MAKKTRKLTRHRKLLNNNSWVLFIGISIALLVLVYSSKSFFKSQTATSGKSLGAFLAKGDEGGGGDDHGGSSGGSGSSGSGSSGGSSDSGSSGGGSSEGSGNSGSSGTSGSSSDSSSGSSGSSGSEGSTSKVIFVNPTTGVKTKIETKEDEDEIKTEIKTGDNRIKTETKNGRTRVETRSAGVKTRFELKEGKLVIKKENENENEAENEQELNENQAQEVENELEKEDIKVSTEGGSLVVLRRGIGARTTLPISIDTATNSLIVTTPAGTKVVTILPDVAINNLIAGNVLSVIENEPADAAELSEVENHLVFEVDGIKKEKFLGLLTVSLRKKVVMNAQTAQVEQEQESLLTRFLDILSV